MPGKRGLFLFLLLVFLLPLTMAAIQQDTQEQTRQLNRSGTPDEEPSNIGATCSTASDCTAGGGWNAICLSCPSDTTVKIQTNHPVVPQETEAKYITKPANNSYCTYSGFPYRDCLGEWEGDEYRVDPSPENTNSSATSELTDDVLEKWKSLVLRNMSEQYFERHFDVNRIDKSVNDNILTARIQYTFEYGWANSSSSELIEIKRYENGEWKWLSDERIAQSLRERRQFLRGRGTIKPTHHEIDSIMSREQALSKLRQCHGGMEIQETYTESQNSSLQFLAHDRVAINPEKCSTGADIYKAKVGYVDLISGDLRCQTSRSACRVYEGGGSGPQGGIVRTVISLVVGIFSGIF